MGRRREPVKSWEELSRPQLEEWLAAQLELDAPMARWLLDLVEDDDPLNISDALRNGEGRDALLRRAERFRSLLREMPGGGARRRPGPPARRAMRDVEGGLRPDEEARAVAVSMALAKDANTTEVVREYRETVLLGRVLTTEEADALLASPAAAVLGTADFLERGIPLVGHQSRVLRHGFEDGTLSVELEVMPGGTIAAELPGLGDDPALPVVEHEPAPAELVRAPVWPDSVLGMLSLVAAWLAARYPWRERDAVWFLLTGQGPRVWPLRTRVEPQMTEPAMHALVEPRRHYMRTVVTMEVEPWVDAKSVARAYRTIQQRLTRGRDKRRIGDRNLHVFAFVVGHIDPRGERPPFAELMERWNALKDIPDEWRYPNPRRFHRDFSRARDALLFGQYDFLSTFASVREEGWVPTDPAPEGEP